MSVCLQLLVALGYFCDVPFAPQVCENERNRSDRFPEPGKFTYSTLCHYDQLTVQDAHTRQCLVLIRSILNTQPRQGFTILVPNHTVLAPDFSKLLAEWNVQVCTFPDAV